MFIMSFRLRAGKLLLCALALVLAVTVGVLGARMIFGGDAVSTSGTVKPGQKVTVKTNEQRLEFVQSFGWEIGEEPLEVMEVIIPKEFDAVYQEYNSIQQKQGYDLAKYAGKRCKRYTYEVTNYPGQAEDVRVNILVVDNKVVGGDVCSIKAEGFMHGFAQETLAVPEAE